MPSPPPRPSRLRVGGISCKERGRLHVTITGLVIALSSQSDCRHCVTPDSASVGLRVFRRRNAICRLGMVRGLALACIGSCFGRVVVCVVGMRVVCVSGMVVVRVVVCQWFVFWCCGGLCFGMLVVCVLACQWFVSWCCGGLCFGRGSGLCCGVVVVRVSAC